MAHNPSLCCSPRGSAIVATSTPNSPCVGRLSPGSDSRLVSGVLFCFPGFWTPSNYVSSKPVEATKLEYNYPPTLKPREEGTAA